MRIPPLDIKCGHDVPQVEYDDTGYLGRGWDLIAYLIVLIMITPALWVAISKLLGGDLW